MDQDMTPEQLARKAAADRELVETLVRRLQVNGAGLPFEVQAWALREKYPAQFTLEETRDMLCAAIAMIAEERGARL